MDESEKLCSLTQCRGIRLGPWLRIYRRGAFWSNTVNVDTRDHTGMIFVTDVNVDVLQPVSFPSFDRWRWSALHTRRVGCLKDCLLMQNSTHCCYERYRCVVVIHVILDFLILFRYCDLKYMVWWLWWRVGLKIPLHLNKVTSNWSGRRTHMWASEVWSCCILNLVVLV